MGRTFAACLLVCACGGDPDPGPGTNPELGPAAGNPDGHCTIPAEGMPASIANPRTVVGTGTLTNSTLE